MIDGVVNTFNRGEIGEFAFGRQEVERVQNSAELVENWMPMRLGAMIRRGGWEVASTTALLTGSRLFDFVYASDETAILELGDSTMRIWKDDALVTRTAVTSTLTGDLSTNLTGWTDASGSGSSVTGTSGGADFVGADTTDAILHQTLGSTQTGAEHGLRIKIKDAPIRLLIGTSGAESDDITDSLLQPGEYSLVFTPDAAATITLINDKNYSAIVESIALEAAGTVFIPTPVPVANVDEIQMAQQAGRIYCSWSGEMFMIERRGAKSWGVVDFRADDGPFDLINTDDGLTLQAGALKGDTTLTASKRHFRDPEDIGSLRKILSTGQEVTAAVTAEDNGTDSVRVTGTNGPARQFTFTISGSFVANVLLQRSVDGVSGWETARGPFTSPINETWDDDLDGTVYFYRLYVPSGGYTSGTVNLSIVYSGGGIEGICRIMSISSATVANVQIVQDMGSTDPSRNWNRGQWGGENGYPNATELYEGRLWLGGKEGVWGSVSDAYRSFDRDIEGNSRSIFKSIGKGPVDEVSWLRAASRMGLALVSDILPVRSSSFGEAITQDNVRLGEGPDTGAARIDPVRTKNAVYFVEAAGLALYSMVYSPGDDGFQSEDQTLLHPNICAPGIAELADTKRPEERVLVRLSDGQARLMLLDKTEGIQGWSRITLAGGTIDRIITLFATDETQIYAKISYGGTEYLCKLAKFSEFNTRPADLFTHYAGPTQACTGLERFNGVSVEAWSGSAKIGDFTVEGGQIDLGASYSDVTVGLTITAKYRSAKLGAYGERSVMAMRKRIVNLAMYLRNVWHETFRFGTEEGRTDALPLVYKGAALDTTALINEYDTVGVPFEGDYGVDSRVYIEATGPATVLAYSYEYEQSERAASAA
ncbi:MAG: hypothetical protein AAFZ74_02135 [Pseudomonadota bacterium]